MRFLPRSWAVRGDRLSRFAHCRFISAHPFHGCCCPQSPKKKRHIKNDKLPFFLTLYFFVLFFVFVFFPFLLRPFDPIFSTLSHSLLSSDSLFDPHRRSLTKASILANPLSHARFTFIPQPLRLAFLTPHLSRPP